MRDKIKFFVRNNNIFAPQLRLARGFKLSLQVEIAFYQFCKEYPGVYNSYILITSNQIRKYQLPNRQIAINCQLMCSIIYNHLCIYTLKKAALLYADEV